MKGIVFDIKRYSIHDGEGLRTTVFLKGCPLRCLWCHNPESQQLEPQMVWYENRCISCFSCIDSCEFNAIKVDSNKRIEISEKLCSHCGECVKVCPTNAIEMIGKEYEAKELTNEILKDELFFEDGGGVTISGGEPFVQYDFLMEILSLLRNEQLNIALDTSGYTSEDKLLSSIKYVSLFLYDLKIMDSKKHKAYTGVDNKIILDNLKSLDENGAKIAVRIPVIPTINDDNENIEKTIDFLLKLKNIVSVDLLPFHNMMIDKYKRLKMPYLLGNIAKPNDNKMEKIKKEFQLAGFQVNIGG